MVTSFVSPHEAADTDLKKLAYNFLWGKRDKVRRRSIINDHINAGLPMVDIDSYFMALKAS